MRTTESFHLPSFLVSLGLGLALFACLASTASFWVVGTPLIIGSSRYGVLIAGIIVFLGSALALPRITSIRLDPLGFAAALGVLFVTDWLTRNYSFLHGPSIRGEIILGGALSFFALRKRWPWFFAALLASAVILLPLSFFSASRGNLLFSDDHPTFLFRLQMLKENFPFIPFYCPLWNGGFDQRDFFATGALSFFLLLSPFVYLFNLLQSYNLLVAIVIFALPPLSTYFAARYERFPKPAACIAALLSLTLGLLWYRWGLKYGTMGFILSASLLPLNTALAARIFRNEHTPRDVVLFVVSFTLMLMWSLAGIAFIPALLFLLFRARTLMRQPLIAGAAAAVLLLNIPWITMFWSVSKVGTFLQAEKQAAVESSAEVPTREDKDVFKTRGGGLSLERSAKVVRESAITIHPLIYIFVLPGLLMLPRRSRWLYACMSLWLLALGSVFVPLKPQLELDRMLVVFSLLGTVPAAAALNELSRRYEGSAPALFQLAPALAGGFLFAGIFSATGILANRSLEQYFFKSSLTDELVEAIRLHGGEGRTLFAGFILHDLNQGHIAPLPLLTGKPLMASTYAHNVWQYQDIFPKEYRDEGETGILRYLDLYNATAVVTHDLKYSEFCAARPDRFQLKWQRDRFALFERVDYQPSYFLEGGGKVVSQSSNGMKVILDAPEAVLKFTYLPFLTTTAGGACRVSEERISETVRFVRLSQCPTGLPFAVQSVSPLKRLLGGRAS